MFALIPSSSSVTFAASSFLALISRLRSPPAKNVFFADVMTTPVMSFFSASSRSTVPALEVVEHGADEHGAGGAERVAHRDRAAVDVELLVRDAQVLLVPEHYRGERLVQLEQVDVLDGQTGGLQHLLRRRRRAGQHDRRVGAAGRGRHDPGARLEPRGLTRRFVADQHQRGAVHDPGRVTRTVYVVDLLDPVVLLQRHRVEAARLADHLERRLQLAQALHGALRAHVLGVVEQRDPVAVLDRYHGLREVAAGPRLRGQLLGPYGVPVDVLAGEALDGGDQVGPDPLRYEVRVVR